MSKSDIPINPETGFPDLGPGHTWSVEPSKERDGSPRAIVRLSWNETPEVYRVQRKYALGSFRFGPKVDSIVKGTIIESETKVVVSKIRVSDLVDIGLVVDEETGEVTDTTPSRDDAAGLLATYASGLPPETTIVRADGSIYLMDVLDFRVTAEAVLEAALYIAEPVWWRREKEERIAAFHEDAKEFYGTYPPKTLKDAS